MIISWYIWYLQRYPTNKVLEVKTYSFMRLSHTMHMYSSGKFCLIVSAYNGVNISSYYFMADITNFKMAPCYYRSYTEKIFVCFIWPSLEAPFLISWSLKLTSTSLPGSSPCLPAWMLSLFRRSSVGVDEWPAILRVVPLVHALCDD